MTLDLSKPLGELPDAGTVVVPTGEQQGARCQQMVAVGLEAPTEIVPSAVRILRAGLVGCAMQRDEPTPSRAVRGCVGGDPHSGLKLPFGRVHRPFAAISTLP